MTQRFQNTLLNAVATTGAGRALAGDDREASVAIFTVTITGSATITFQGSADSGVTTYSIPVTSVAASPVTSTTVTASGIYRCDASGITVFPNVTTYGSGTITVVGSLERGTLSGGASSGGGSSAITVANGADTALGSTTDAAQTDYTQAATLIALTKGTLETLQGTGAGAVVPVKQQDASGNVQPAGDVAGRALFVQAQGEVADASSATGISSLIVGGTDAGGLARTASNILISSTPTSTSQYGIVTYSSLAGLSSANVVRPLVTASGFTPGGSAAQTITVVPCRAVTSSTYEQEYNNLNVTLLSSSARTTTQTSADQTNFNHTKLVVVLDVTAGTTPALTLTINGKDAASGKYYNLLTGLAVATVSTNVYTLALGVTVVANTTVNAFVPRLFQIVVTAGNGNTITYSVGYSLVQ